ncbi:MAG: DMT family transporter [Caryophanon sp.]|nr:DMT family transporter [Caryophanon sp.]
MGKQGKANSLLVIVTMFWGLSYTFMVLGLDSMGIFSLVALRCAVGFVVAAAIFHKKMHMTNMRSLSYSAIQGFLLFVLFAASLIGLQTTSVANAGFILSLTVVLVPLFTAVLERTLPSRAVSIAIVATLIGISILTIQPGLAFHQGDIIIALAAVAYAVYLILNSTFAQKQSVESIPYSVYQIGFASLFAFICIPVFGETFTLPETANAWIAVLGLGLICTAFCFIGQTVAQQYTSATHTGLIFSLEPIFAAMFAAIFLADPITMKLLLGGSFILIGNLVAQLEQFQQLRIIKKSSLQKVTS